MENYILQLVTKTSTEVRKLKAEEVSQVKNSEVIVTRPFGHKNYKQRDIAKIFQDSINN